MSPRTILAFTLHTVARPRVETIARLPKVFINSPTQGICRPQPRKPKTSPEPNVSQDINRTTSLLYVLNTLNLNLNLKLKLKLNLF